MHILYQYPVRHRSHPPSPRRGRFLNSMHYPYHALAVCYTRLILIGSWLPSPSQVHHCTSCPHPHTTCVLPLLYILCKITRLCTYQLIRPPTTYPLVLLWTVTGLRVPVTCCILARPFRFPGLIHLPIWVFFCVSQYITFAPRFHFFAVSSPDF